MTTRTTATCLLLTAAVMAPWGAGAQQPPAQRGDGHRPPRPPIDTVLDADRDEVIDADEIAAAATVLRTLDGDGDWRLSQCECLPARPQGGPGPAAPGAARQQPPAAASGTGERRPPSPPIFAALDRDGSGVLEAAEIAAAAAALASLDRDGDGRLIPDEYRPPRPDGAPAEQGESR